MNLNNRHILITGGARGLGRAFAEAAVRAGAEVVIADILESGREVAKSLGARFIQHILEQLDGGRLFVEPRQSLCCGIGFFGIVSTRRQSCVPLCFGAPVASYSMAPCPGRSPA